jgi:decaprenyl-phosphate phosphoribosyltransferase
VACCYLALTLSYSLWLRRAVVLDMVAIAGGFVLRAAAGGAASDIYLSRWFVIVTGCGAVFVVAAKRYAELREQAGAPALRTRASLRRYSPGLLRATLLAAAGAGAIAYAGWAFTRPAHVGLYALSIAPFVLWLARYTQLIGMGAGETPEEIVLGDRALLALSVMWAALFLGGVYAGR